MEACSLSRVPSASTVPVGGFMYDVDSGLLSRLVSPPATPVVSPVVIAP